MGIASKEIVFFGTHAGPLECHEVKTEDGYLLTLYRVPIRIRKDSTDSGVSSSRSVSPNDRDEDILNLLEDSNSIPKETINKKLPIVLIVHGVVCCGTNWFCDKKDKVLPYVLSNAGYDCWIANLRGTSPSKGHSDLATNSKQYWDFSIDEIGRHDLPAKIDYILKTTQNSDLNYIGHSMGCSVFFALISQRPEYTTKISKMIALAPALSGKSNTNKYLRIGTKIGSFLAKYQSIYCFQFPPNPVSLLGYIKRFLPKCLVKKPERIAIWFLSTIAVNLGIYGTEQIEKERLSLISKYWPSSTSFKNLSHLSQMYRSVFRPYDYGEKGNLKRYGITQPPPYELQNVKVPVAVIYSDGDELCASRDVIEATQVLPNLIKTVHIRNSNFSHMDFMAGKDADKLVFEPVLDILNQTFSIHNLHTSKEHDDY